LQTQYVVIEWDWDAKLKIYVKEEYCGGSDPPTLASCWHKDWAFVD
jgi:hypothetical protein